jgi:hypothetical protein
MKRRLAVTLGLVLASGCSSVWEGSLDGNGPADAAADHVGVPGEAGGNDSAAAGGEAGSILDLRAETGPPTPPDAEGGTRPPAEAGTGDADGPLSEVSKEGGGAPWPNLCARATRTIKLPSPPLTGELSGPSENPAVSCKGFTATEGSEEIFALEIDQLTTVDLRVDSSIFTFIAIRTGCSDGNSEIACEFRPPNDAEPAVVDGGGTPDAAADGSATPAAGPDGPASDSPHTAGLRVRLPPGTYTVVVDTPASDVAAAAAFTLTARAMPLPKNADCALPMLLSSSTSVTDQELDLVGAPTLGCVTGAQAALFYAVTIPSGQRLTARAVSKGGDRSWMPRLEAFDSCGSGVCLAQGHATAGTVQQLDWINNGPNWRIVMLSVTADGPVTGARFDLTVSASDLLATCVRPTSVKDGTVLINQDLLQAPPPTAATCSAAADHALYYTATLLPQQAISVWAAASATPGDLSSAPASLALRSSCDERSCLSTDRRPFTLTNYSGYFANYSSQTMTIIIEATGTSGLFDLQVSMWGPPAGVTVLPPGGLVTTEAGGSATFQVVLASPPSAAVTIGLASDTTSEGLASPSSLRFDATNWDTPQTVTVTGVDDQAADGPRPYVIVTGAAVSSDAHYSGLGVGDVSVTNLDDEPGFLFEGADALATSESGATAIFTARLNRQPTATVRLSLTSSNVGEGTVSPTGLMFSPSDWNVPQAVTITGVDDALFDGTQTYAIVTGPVVSTDPGYAGQDPPDLSVHNRDNDYHPVAAKLLSGDLACGAIYRAPFLPRHQIAVDAFNTLYVVMHCSTGLTVVTSVDGGVTFSEPLLLPGTSDLIGDGVIAGGEGGVAYLAYQTKSMSLMFTRTTNGGGIWSTPEALPRLGERLQLAASGQLVIVMAEGPGNGIANTIVLRSLDGGRTFVPRGRFDISNQYLALEPDGKTIWLMDGMGDGRLRKSTDGGATFATIRGYFGSGMLVIAGIRSLFSTYGIGVSVTSLVDSSVMRTIFSGLVNGPIAMAVDDADNLTMFSSDGMGRLGAMRLGAGASVLSTGKVIGPQADSASAVALSRNAVATCFNSGNLVLFAVGTWP